MLGETLAHKVYVQTRIETYHTGVVFRKHGGTKNIVVAIFARRRINGDKEMLDILVEYILT
jgi:hypothetical protein